MIVAPGYRLLDVAYVGTPLEESGQEKPRCTQATKFDQSAVRFSSKVVREPSIAFDQHRTISSSSTVAGAGLDEQRVSSVRSVHEPSYWMSPAV